MSTRKLLLKVSLYIKVSLNQRFSGSALLPPKNERMDLHLGGVSQNGKERRVKVSMEEHRIQWLIHLQKDVNTASCISVRGKMMATLTEIGKLQF